VRPIDLACALRLAGVQNPEILLARERVVEAVALRQLAAAQYLPSINAGSSLDHHLGTLQQSSGAITKLHRDALYVGLGAGAVGGGSVAIPGIAWNGNLSETYFRKLVAKQVVQQRAFESEAIRNDVLLRTAVAYTELLRAAGHYAVAREIREDAREVARVTANFAKTGQGRQADADRASVELEQRQTEVIQAENDLQVSSARLAQLLSLDPSVRLVPVESFVVPQSIVPEPIPLCELIAIAMVQRPELKARQAAIRAAFLALRGEKCLPFSPNLIIGYSVGDFGGGGDQTQPRFGNFGDREDFDVVMYWTAQNLGIGNVALIRLARSNLRQNELQQIAVLDQVRSEVATAHARIQSRLLQIDRNEKAIEASRKAFTQDLARTRQGEGLPIEVLDSLRLLARSRYGYLDSIIDYDRAHFEMYVALGQPPADVLARPVAIGTAPPAPGKDAAPR
jgi:outer membrane protein TolC